MPNYANSIIYKLCCKDTSIIDIYIGSTTNKTKRKQHHKHYCNNETREDYNRHVYQFIRVNGGFENFDMIVIENYPCKNKTELETRERYWLEQLKATLNKRIPSRTIEEYREVNRDKINEKAKEKNVCECGCEISRYHLARHRKTKKHLDYLNNLK